MTPSHARSICASSTETGRAAWGEDGTVAAIGGFPIEWSVIRRLRCFLFHRRGSVQQSACQRVPGPPEPRRTYPDNPSLDLFVAKATRNRVGYRTYSRSRVPGPFFVETGEIRSSSMRRRTRRSAVCGFEAGGTLNDPHTRCARTRQTGSDRPANAPCRLIRDPRLD